MILYTLAPLAEHLLPPKESTKPTVSCFISGGHLFGTMTEEGLRITGIVSTDPTVYLKKEYDIGTLHTDLFPVRR